ncbi:MAG: tetratricopeptide repeat protein [Planctomycetaceae bacterium]
MVPRPQRAATNDEEAQDAPPPQRVYWLNRRLLVVSLVLVAVAVGGVFALHETQQFRLRGALRKRAEQKLAAGEPAAAAGELRQYLSLSPDDLEARLQLDTLQWENATTRDAKENAIHSSEALLRDHPDLVEVRERQVEQLVGIGRFTDALDHLARLREDGANETAWDVWEGLCHEGSREYRKAEQAYARSLQRVGEFAPVPFRDRELTRFDVLARLVGLYTGELNDKDLAFDLVDRGIAKYPESAELLTLRAQLRANFKSAPEANFADLDKAVKLAEAQEAPPALDTVLLYGQEIRRTSNPDSARLEGVIEHCRRLAEEGTQDVRLYQEWAGLENLRGRRDAAIAALRKGRDALPQEPLMAAFLIDELINGQQLEEARQLVVQTQAAGMPEAAADYLQGRLALSAENWTAARDHFRNVPRRGNVPANIKSRAALFLGLSYGRLGAFDQELMCYREAAADITIMTPVQLAEARCLANLGRYEEAAQMYLRLSPSEFAAAELVRVELSLVLQTPPEQRNWQAFDDRLAAALRTQPNDPELVLLQAESLSGRGQRAEAADLLRRATAASPAHLGLWIARVELALREGDATSAADIIKAAREVHGSHVRLDAVEIPIWEQGDRDEVLGRLSALEQRQADVPAADRVFMAQRLAASYERLQQNEQAYRLRKVIAFELSPTRDSLLQLFTLAMKGGDTQTATAVRDRLREIEGEDDVFATYAEVILGLRHEQPSRKEVQAALNTLGELSRRRPNLPMFPLAQAAIHERTGDLRDAADNYLTAVNQGVRDPLILRRLVSLLNTQQRYGELDRISAMLAAQPDKSPGHQQVLVESALLAGHRDLAADRVQEFASDLGDHVWKGWMLLAAGKTVEAEAAFRQAIEAAPQQDNAWLILAQFLMEQKRRDEAEKVAAEARPHLTQPESPARLDEILGRLPAAEAQFRKIAEEDASSAGALSLAGFFIRTGQVAKSVPVLEPLAEGRGGVAQGDRVVARRMLAAALASRNYAGLKRAIELLDQNAGELDDPSTDRRQQAHLLALYPFLDHASQIVNLLTALQARQPLTPADTVVLAKAHDLRKNEQEANAAWDSLLTARSLPPVILKQYIERQLRRERTKTVAAPLAQLEETIGLDGDVLRYKAWMMCLTNNSDKALESVRQYVHSTSGDPKQRAVNRKLLAAGVLRQLTELPSGSPEDMQPLAEFAEELYAQILDELPSAALPYSLLLTNQDRGQDAVNTLEAVRGRVPEPQLLAAAIHIVESANVPAAAAQKIEQWVTTFFHAQSSTSDAVVLYEHYLRVCGKWEQAVDLNRRMLAAIPDNFAVLNNQAWLFTVQGLAGDALPLITRAIELAGPTSYLLDTRGMVRLSLNDTSGAIDDLNQALAQTDSDVIRFHLALAYLRAGNEEAARTQFNRLPEDRSTLRRVLPVNERKDFDQFTERFAALKDARS